MVPHRGTNWAAPWLTSQIGRDAVLSRSYGRGYPLRFPVPYLPHFSDPALGFQPSFNSHSPFSQIDDGIPHCTKLRISASFLISSVNSLEGRSERAKPYLANSPGVIRSCRLSTPNCKLSHP